jgi:hypothetical protein
MLADTAIDQIDAVLAFYKQKQSTPAELREASTRMKAAIERLSPRESTYRSSAEEVVKGSIGRAPYNSRLGFQLDSPQHQSRELAAILTAMRADYEAGFMQTFSELIHADLFADFLEMAAHLLEGGYKDPAAVLAGSVLEEHIRKLCEKNGLPITDSSGKPAKADRLNADLTGANVYSGLDQKQVTAWLDLRNKAAHGEYGEYSQPQVELMISGVRDFLVRNPA